MSRESQFIDRLRAIACHPAARGLADDCAVLPMGDRDLVITHDMLVEGVHYLPGDPAADVAWKLVAVNLSDLAAKGAKPIGMLLGYPLHEHALWDADFAEGLAEASAAFGVALLGGDTVSVPKGAARQIGLTAIGEVRPGAAPARSGARAGDTLWVTGVIGAAGLGLAIAKGETEGDAACLAAYRRPQPRLAEGRALAPLVNAMADVSDGLLIDAQRMGEASGVQVIIDLDAVPVPPGADRIKAVTAGDDYELLFALAPGRSVPGGIAATQVGQFSPGIGIVLESGGIEIALPDRLGYEHGT